MEPDAPVMATYIATHDLRPDLIVCSDAVRARATLTLVLQSLGGPSPVVRYEPRLYLAEPAAIMEVVSRIEPSVGRCINYSAARVERYRPMPAVCRSDTRNPHRWSMKRGRTSRRATKR